MKQIIVCMILILTGWQLFGEQTTIPIVYLGDFDGRFIDLSPKSEWDYSKTLEKINYYKNILPMKTGCEQPIILSNGATFGPDLSVKHILLSKKSGISFLGSLLEHSQFDIVNLGKKDFYAPKDLMQLMVEGTTFKKIPFMVSNMQCSDLKQPLCQLTQNRRVRIINSGGIKIGIISVVDPSVMENAAKDNVIGFKIEDPVGVINRLGRKLKKKGVDFIVVLAQVESRESTPKKVIDLAQKIEYGDLIISNLLNVRLIRNQERNTLIVGGTQSGDPGVLMATFEKGKEGVKLVKIKDLSEEAVSGKMATSSGIESVLKRYKKSYLDGNSADLTQLTINKEITRTDFITYMIHLIREHSDAELAMINTETFSQYGNVFPAQKLTSDLINRGIVYNDPVRIVAVQGKFLKRFLKKNINHPKLHLIGATVKKVKKSFIYKVNNRVVIDKKYYTIATTEYLARGGDRYFDGIPVKQMSQDKSLKKIIFETFQERRFQRAQIFSPELQFTDLTREFIWELRHYLGISFIRTALKNKPGYEDTNFEKVPLTSFQLDWTLGLEGDSRYHLLDNSINISYYLLNEDNGGYQENKDLIYYLFNYKNNFFKSGNSSFFIPLPYFETKVESEFDLPKDRTYRHMELYLSAGTSFLSLNRKFEFNLGFSLIKELLYDDGGPTYGVSTGVRLKPYKLDFFAIPVKIEGYADYFIALSQTRDDTARVMGKLYIPLLNYFYLNAKYSGYFYKNGTQDWGYTYDMVFGVNLMLNHWF